MVSEEAASALENRKNRSALVLYDLAGLDPASVRVGSLSHPDTDLVLLPGVRDLISSFSEKKAALGAMIGSTEAWERLKESPYARDAASVVDFWGRQPSMADWKDVP